MSNAIILMNNQLKPQQVEMLTQLAEGYRFVTKADLAEGDFEYVEIMYGWDKSYTEAQRQSFKRLKWIQATSAGVDYLPMDIIQNPQIMISNMSGIHATPIAESVFGYLLATGRQLFTSQLQQRESNWNRPEHGGYFSLKDKVLGSGSVCSVSSSAYIGVYSIVMFSEAVTISSSSGPADTTTDIMSPGTKGVPLLGD